MAPSSNTHPSIETRVARAEARLDAHATILDRVSKAIETMVRLEERQKTATDTSNTNTAVVGKLEDTVSDVDKRVSTIESIMKTSRWWLGVIFVIAQLVFWAAAELLTRTGILA